MHYDVIVVGTGPAGSSAAYVLAAGGAKVALIEKEVLPRHKTCGGAMPMVVRDVLELDGFRDVTPEAFVEADARWMRHTWKYGQAILAPINPEPAHENTSRPISIWMVQRSIFDNALAQRAARAGAVLRDGLAVRRLALDGSGRIRVQAEGKNGTWDATANFLIGADGANGPVARSFGLRRERALAIAIEVEVPHRWGDGVPHLRSDVCHLEWGAVELGYAWVFPKRDHLNVGAGVFRPHGSEARSDGGLRRHLHNTIHRYLEMLGVPKRPEELTYHAHPIPLWNGLDAIQTSDNRVLLTGDAAGLVNPFFGDGILHALKSGRMAADCILQDNAAGYTQAIAAEFGENFDAALKRATFFYNWAEPCYRHTFSRPEASHTAAQMLCGSVLFTDRRAGLIGDGYRREFLDDFIDSLATRIDRRIEQFFPKVLDEQRVRHYVGPPQWQHDPQAYSGMLSRPIWDLISRKGKRWRPGFCILLLEALGTCSDAYEELLCVLPELLHTGALIIDDIEDGSQIRRGAECIHLRYGVDVAINAANTLYFLPSLILFNHRRLTEKQRLRIYEVINQVFIRAHFGQALDIYHGRQLTRANLDQWLGESLAGRLLQMHAYKTGSFSEGLAEIAAIIAEADEEKYRACVSFGRAFGVAFQIMDDVRNFSESPQWTKTCGEDLAAGKITYAILRALELLQGCNRERLAEILCSETLRKTPDTLREGIRLVQQSGALASCRTEANAQFEREWARLAPLLPSFEAKTLLRPFFSKVLDLPYDP